MTLRIPPRLIAPLIACGIAGAAAIVGGACTWPATSDPPTLRTGNYVLTAPSSPALPGIITDSLGRKLRVIADTLAFNVSDQTYEQRATVAITPPGGVEQAPAPFLVSRRRYAIPSTATVSLSSTLYGGFITGTILSPTGVLLTMPDHTQWRYDYR
jgi:hypothetical protein